jgi:osmotically-inducible protein OsmY
MRQLIVLCMGISVLGGCTSVVDSVTNEPIVADPASTSAGTYYNDRKMDTFIGVNIKKAHPDLDASHINVSVAKAVVLLTGEVPSREMKILAGDTARDFTGVRLVHNELQVRGKTSIVSRTNDSVITAKIKTKLAFEEQVKAINIDVITEDSVVYLMGTIDRVSGDLAADIASASGGVRKVVKVFEYID